MEHPMMDCGHAANAIDGDGNPACVICSMIGGKTPKPVDTPDFKDRIAMCSYKMVCSNTQPSSTDLAFFEHKPEEEHDNYYCGCQGWG